MATSRRSLEKEAFWRLVLSEQQQSGLSIRAFCAEEGLSEPSFYAWRREIRKRDAGGNASIENHGSNENRSAVRKRKTRNSKVADSKSSNQLATLIPVDVIESFADARLDSDAAVPSRERPTVHPTAPLEMVTPGGFTLRCGQAVPLAGLIALLEAMVRCEKVAYGESLRCESEVRGC